MGFFTLFMSAVVIFLAVVVRVDKIRDTVIIYGWALPLLWACGVRGQVRGRERIAGLPKGFIVLFHHSSHIDIPVLFYFFPRFVKFGAKVELFKVPFFGKAMKLCGVLPIDRGNRSAVMQVYANAESRVEKGEVFALAPEGTRQNEAAIGKFKRGPFEFAINAKATIVPVTLAGVFEVLPKTSVWLNLGRWKRNVLMEIGTPIPTHDWSLDQVDQLQERVRQEMVETFARLHSEIY